MRPFSRFRLFYEEYGHVPPGHEEGPHGISHDPVSQGLLVPDPVAKRGSSR